MHEKKESALTSPDRKHEWNISLQFLWSFFLVCSYSEQTAIPTLQHPLFYLVRIRLLQNVSAIIRSQGINTTKQLFLYCTTIRSFSFTFLLSILIQIQSTRCFDYRFAIDICTGIMFRSAGQTKIVLQNTSQHTWLAVPSCMISK